MALDHGVHWQMPSLPSISPLSSPSSQHQHVSRIAIAEAAIHARSTSALSDIASHKTTRRQSTGSLQDLSISSNWKWQDQSAAIPTAPDDRVDFISLKSGSTNRSHSHQRHSVQSSLQHQHQGDLSQTMDVFSSPSNTQPSPATQSIPRTPSQGLRVPAASRTPPASAPPAMYEQSSSIRMTASTSDDALRAAVSTMRAEAQSNTFQIDCLRKYVAQLEEEQTRLHTVNHDMHFQLRSQQQQMTLALQSGSDSSTQDRMQNSLLQIAQHELRECQNLNLQAEMAIKESESRKRLQEIHFEAKERGWLSEISRLQQENEEMSVLYRGKQRQLELAQSNFDHEKRGTEQHLQEKMRREAQMSEHLVKLKDSLISVSSALKKERFRCSHASEALKVSEQRRQEIEDSRESLQKLHEEAESEIRSLRDQISELESGDVADLKRQHQNEINALTSLHRKEVESLQCKLLSSRPKSFEHLNPKLEQELIDARTRIDELERQMEIGPTKNVDDSPTKKQHTVSPAERRILELEEQLASQKNFPTEEGDECNGQRQLENQLRERDQRVNTLQAQLLEISKRSEETEQLCDLLQSELDTARSQWQQRAASVDPVKDGLSGAGGDLVQSLFIECKELKDANERMVIAHNRLREQLIEKTAECAESLYRLEALEGRSPESLSPAQFSVSLEEANVITPQRPEDMGPIPTQDTPVHFHSCRSRARRPLDMAEAFEDDLAKSIDLSTIEYAESPMLLPSSSMAASSPYRTRYRSTSDKLSKSAGSPG